MKWLIQKSTILRLILVCLLTTILGCNGRNTHNSEQGFYANENGYEDATYCAEVDYYYSETGTSSTYTLEVEIEDNELKAIHWPNGGWLDDSHFSPPEISDGEASFTSDRGGDYTVRIIGNEGECNLDSYVIDEDELIQEYEEQTISTQEEEEEIEEGYNEY